MFKKMLTRIMSLAFVLSLVFIAISVGAEGVEKNKLAVALEKYDKTGKIEKCVRADNIRSTRVIDDFNILFFMRGKKAYLNTMKHRCSHLGFEKSFSYEVQTNLLCSKDFIKVFKTTSSIQGRACGLGKFVEYKKKPRIVKAEN